MFRLKTINCAISDIDHASDVPPPGKTAKVMLLTSRKSRKEARHADHGLGMTGVDHTAREAPTTEKVNMRTTGWG